MTGKPIFVATHPRACSTAFERVFMTRSDDLTCIHEPFGDAFYFGPERMSERFAGDKKTREDSGYSNITYKNVFERLEREGAEGKRLFIKDITYYLVPPNGEKAQIAPSLIKEVANNNVATIGIPNGVSHGGSEAEVENALYPFNTHSEPGNSTIVPTSLLEQFHFTFLIRHPRSSIPSYYRTTIPPLDAVTGFYHFMPSEAGYSELRRVFDYLRIQKQVGPARAGQYVGSLSEGKVSITVIDADDLLDNPSGIIEAYCREVGLDFSPDMLNWEGEAEQERSKTQFEKWPGFHDDVVASCSLKPRSSDKKKNKTVESENAEWLEKYGPEAQKVIRDCVDANIPDYEYLKSFALRV